MLRPSTLKKKGTLFGLAILILSALTLLIFLTYRTVIRSNASENPTQEAEAGNLNGTVTINNDSNASGGRYIQFGNALPTPTPAPAPTWDNIALTPPMGFNQWNHFHSGATESTVMQIADAMVANGMRDAGYNYINLDESWARQSTDPQARDGAGDLNPNNNYPSGIKALADYVHARGFKFGIYTSPGPKACGGAIGSKDHVDQDVRAFARWGVDFIKLDWCTIPYEDEDVIRAVTAQWKSAILASGRPMVLSIMSGGASQTGEWSKGATHMWRTEGDLCDSWYNRTRTPDPQQSNCFARTFFMGIYDYLILNINPHANATTPNHWQDPDMMQVGNPGLSYEEAKTHFSMWAMWSAPLLAGNDPRNPMVFRNNEAPYNGNDIMLNTEIIAIDQDRDGKVARKIQDNSGLQVWNKQLSGNGNRAVAFVNTSDSAQNMSFNLRDLGFSNITSVRDLWLHQNLSTNTNYSASIPAHGTVVLKVSGN